MIKISDSELEVMKVLWKDNPLSSNEIISKLKENNDWSDNTIKTFINRLAKKDALRVEGNVRSYIYYPNIDYQEYASSENKNFLDSIYNGSVNMLLSKFIEDEDLTSDDIDEIQSLLDEKKKDIKLKNL